MRVGCFIVFDYGEAAYCGEECYVVEGGVRVCALLFLLCGVRGLDDEDALDEEEHGGGVEELGSDQSFTPAGDNGGRRTGWAANRDRSLENIAPQTMAASCYLSVVVRDIAPVGLLTIHAPNWATTPVPIPPIRLQHYKLISYSLTKNEVIVERLPFSLRRISRFTQKRLLFCSARNPPL